MKYHVYYIFLLFTTKIVCRIVRYLKNRFYQDYLVAYCLWRKVKFTPKRIHFNGNSQLDFNPGAIVELGNDFICRSGYSIDNSSCSKIIVLKGAHLKIGNFSGMTNTVLHCHNKVHIGDYVNIGAGTMIFDTDFHSTNWEKRASIYDLENRKCSPIMIGNHVFIGTRCIICKGVCIGEKSIVAAGSVVTRNIPSNEVWGGNPARFIKNINN